MVPKDKRQSIGEGYVTTRATSVVKGSKEGRNNRKEYHSTSRARKVRLKIVASYCNILKVSQVLAFSTLGRCSFPFYKQMEGASGQPTELQKYIAYILYSGLFRCLGHPWPYHILPKALGPIPLLPNIVMRPCLIHLSKEGVPVGRVLTWKERYPAPGLPLGGRSTRGIYS